MGLGVFVPPIEQVEEHYNLRTGIQPVIIFLEKSGYVLSGIPSCDSEARFSLAILLRSQKMRRDMKTSASNPPTIPPTIAPTGVCFEAAEFWKTCDDIGEADEAEVEAGGIKTRVGMEARLENEGVYVI